MGIKNNKILQLMCMFCVCVLTVVLIPQSVTVLNGLFRILLPLLVGFAVAFVVNIPMSFFEEHFPRINKREVSAGVKRIICMILSFVVIIAMILFVFMIVLPELGRCITVLIEKIPVFFKSIEVFFSDPSFGEMIPESVIAYMNSIDWNKAIRTAVDFMKNGIEVVTGNSVAAISNIFSTFVTGMFGVIFSVYFLLGKDKLKAQVDRLCKAYLSERNYERVIYVARVANTSFHSYVVGQVSEAVILGALCCGGMLLFRFPYAAMTSVLIGFTALIPIAGAYIGAGVGFVVIFTVSPKMAFLFLVFIVILQQLEGNLIFPKVVGSSIGLPGVWVLAAVTIFSAIAGVPGILLGVPFVATTYRLLQSDMRSRLADKKG